MCIAVFTKEVVSVTSMISGSLAVEITVLYSLFDGIRLSVTIPFMILCETHHKQHVFSDQLVNWQFNRYHTSDLVK